MYQVTVIARVLNNRDTVRLVVPLLTWMILFFIILGVMGVTGYGLLVLPLGIEFLCIIPLSIWLLKKARKIHKKSIVSMDVILTARDGIIYKDDMKLNVSYIERDHEVWLDDLHDGGKYNHYCVTFSASVIEEDINGFIEFCRDNGVKIETFNE